MYRLMTARRVSTGQCGHLILPGDVIGYDHQTHKSKCRECMKAERLKRQEAMNERMKVE